MLEPSGRCLRRVCPSLRCLVKRRLHKHPSPPDSSPLPAVLMCVTGVAGSGKCSLVAGLIDTLRCRPAGVGRGSEVVVVDQRPDGRSSRFQPRHLRRRVRPPPAGVPLRQPGLAHALQLQRPSANGSNPAIYGHRKSGHFPASRDGSLRSTSWRPVLARLSESPAFAASAATPDRARRAHAPTARRASGVKTSTAGTSPPRPGRKAHNCSLSGGTTGVSPPGPKRKRRMRPAR